LRPRLASYRGSATSEVWDFTFQVSLPQGGACQLAQAGHGQHHRDQQPVEARDEVHSQSNRDEVQRSKEAQRELIDHLARLVALIELLAERDAQEERPQRGMNPDTLRRRRRQKDQDGGDGNETSRPRQQPSNPPKSGRPQPSPTGDQQQDEQPTQQRSQPRHVRHSVDTMRHKGAQNQGKQRPADQVVDNSRAQHHGGQFILHQPQVNQNSGNHRQSGDRQRHPNRHRQGQVMSLSRWPPQAGDEPDQRKAQNKGKHHAQQTDGHYLGADLAHLRLADLQTGDKEKEQHADSDEAIARQAHSLIGCEQALIGGREEHPKQRRPQDDPADELADHRRLA
jgi:hypothetical protein